MKKLDLNSHAGTVTASDIVGIDLGTTNSAVSVYSANTVPTILDIGKDGGYTVPSCVMWCGGDKFIVGVKAYEQRYKSNVCYSVKRIMGSDTPIILRTDDGEQRTFSPAEISAEILKELKRLVEEYYLPVDQCIITVPAYFNQRQIEDTLKAAKLAGWNCRQILKEPTSASYIYSMLGYAGSTGTRLIYDLGGGTFDATNVLFIRTDEIPSKMVSSLKRQYGIDFSNISGVDSTDQYICRVLGTYGDMNLGGDDIDKCLADLCIKRAGSPSLSREDKEKLILTCESFKRAGFNQQSTTIGGIEFSITQEDLKIATEQIFERTMDTLKDAYLGDVKSIVLVGGSTKSQFIRESLAERFPEVEISAVLDPDATVALGAGAVAKAVSNNGEMAYADVLPLPIGVLVNEESVDVCIPKNTSMPYMVSRNYYTLHDGQERVTIHVYQGLSTNPKEDTYLGKLTIDGIPNASAGDVIVKVNFILDGQGRLKITAIVDGVEKPVDLVIDNIFSVAERGTGVKGEHFDEFEQCFMPLLENNEEAILLFEKRRKTDPDSHERQDIEDAIIELLE